MLIQVKTIDENSVPGQMHMQFINVSKIIRKPGCLNRNNVQSCKKETTEASNPGLSLCRGKGLLKTHINQISKQANNSAAAYFAS